MRIRKKSWAGRELETNKRFIKINYKNKWHEIFENNNTQINLEIGCGKGKFITQLANKNLNINYIALEKYKNIIASALRVASSVCENNNLFFIQDDAKNLEKYFCAQELDLIYINFCDPWVKRKHEKRRLTHECFLSLYKKILKPNGKIIFKTDNHMLFEFSIKEFIKNNWQLENINKDLYRDKNLDLDIMTEYEKKFVSQGMKIYYLEARLNL